jgi:hypothetical protein
MPERHQVFRLHPSKQPINSYLAIFRHLIEPETATAEPHGDDVLKTYKRPAADEEDVGRVERNAGC